MPTIGDAKMQRKRILCYNFSFMCFFKNLQVKTMRMQSVSSSNIGNTCEEDENRSKDV